MILNRPDELIGSGVVIAATGLKTLADLPITGEVGGLLDVAKLGSNVIVCALVLYFILRYQPRQEERQDEKDKRQEERNDIKEKLFFDAIISMREEDRRLRHDENDKDHAGMLAVRDEIRQLREALPRRRHPAEEEDR